MKLVTKWNVISATHKIIFLFIAGLLFESAIFCVLYKLVGTDLGFVSSDAVGYYSLAQGVAKTGHVLPDIDFLDAARTPGYPLYVALFLKLFGSGIPALVVQMCIGALAGPLLYASGKLLFRNDVIAFVGALFFQLEPGRVFWTTQYMTETLALIAFLGALLVFLKLLERTTVPWIFPASLGLLLGIGTLMRPSLSMFWAVFAIFFVIFKKSKTIEWKKLLKQATFLGVGVLVVQYVLLSPWILRNSIVYGEAKLSSIYAAGTFYIVAPRALEYRYGIGDQAARDQLFEETMHELGLPVNTDTMIVADIRYSDQLYAKGKKVVFQNFPWFVESAVARLPFYLLNHDYAYESVAKLQKNLNAPIDVSPVKLVTLHWFGRMLWALVYVLVLLGLVMFFPIVKKQWKQMVFLLFLMVFTTAQVIVMDPARYKLMVNPFLLFLFAFTLYQMFVSARLYTEKLNKLS